jgi:hypothetical protein
MPLTRANADGEAPAAGSGLSIHEDVAVSADALWAILRDFGGLVAWNPFVAGCKTFFDGGQMFRVVETSDGVRILERADVLDGGLRKLAYTIISSDPVRPFVGRMTTILIDPITDTRSRITWSAEQKGISLEPEQMDALTGAFRARINALVTAAHL